MFTLIYHLKGLVSNFHFKNQYIVYRIKDEDFILKSSIYGTFDSKFYPSIKCNVENYTKEYFTEKYSNYEFRYYINDNEFCIDGSGAYVYKNDQKYFSEKLSCEPIKENYCAKCYEWKDALPYDIQFIYDFNQELIRCKIIGSFIDFVDIHRDSIFYYYIPDVNKKGYNEFLVLEAHSVTKQEICIGQNAIWTIKINIADQVVGMFKNRLSFQKLIGHDNDNIYFSLNDGRIYEVNVLTGDFTIIHNEYSQIRYGQYLDTETKEIFGSENYILEVLDLLTRQKTKHNLKPLFEQHGMTGTKNLLYVDKKHLYYGDNGKGGILILERGTFQPVWYEKTKPVLDLQIDGDHMAVYHMGNHLTLYKRTDTLTEQEKNMALQLVEAQVTEEQQPKKIIRPGFKIEQLAPHQRNGVDMPTEVYEREMDGFYHEGHILDLIEGMADLTHGILKMESIEVKPFEKSEEPKKKCQTSLVIKGKEYKLNFDMFYAGLENFDFLSSMNRLLKETGYEGGNVFCDVTEDAHFIRFVFVTPEKYAEMDKAGIVCHFFDADNY